MRGIWVCLLPVGLLASPLPSAAPPKEASPFCSDSEATRRFLKELCDFISKEKQDVPTIFIGGYYMRTLVAGYEIFGERRYLDVAIAYADNLLKKQSPRGYWGTGYGNIYLADTGSALGLFLVLSKHVAKEKQKEYFDAIQRYVTAIETDGLINSSGAIGTGWRATKDGTITGPYKDEYTISSGLTGAQIFTWMHHTTKNEKYRQVAVSALRWILSTMREDGVIPYVLAGEGTVLGKKGDPKNDQGLWERWPYCTSAYVGEGLLSFDLYCAQAEWKAEIRKKIKPHIEWLLRTQNPDGAWTVKGSQDQKRSPGVVNFLIWYHQNVDKDPRIVAAVRKFNQFLLIPDRAKAFGILTAGGQSLDPKTGKAYLGNDIITSLTGRAVADILSPGIDSKW